MMLERDVAREIDRYLTETLGLTVFRADPRGKTRWVRPNSAGLPDRFGILPNGRMWAVEIKSPTSDRKPGSKKAAKDQPKQQQVREHLVANGALYIVATSLAEVHERLNPQILNEHHDVAAILDALDASREIHTHAASTHSKTMSGGYDPARDDAEGR